MTGTNELWSRSQSVSLHTHRHYVWGTEHIAMVISEEIAQIPVRGDGRERILDEARSLFLTKGFAATSMQEIADAVGLTKPALYYHFKDKQELMLAVIGREMSEGWEIFTKLFHRTNPCRSGWRMAPSCSFRASRATWAG